MNKEIILQEREMSDGYAKKKEKEDLVGFIMMFESSKDDCVSFNSEKQNKTSNLNSFKITQVMPEVLEMIFNEEFIQFSNLSYLFLNAFEQNRISISEFLQDFINIRGICIHNLSHHLLNSSMVLDLPRGSFIDFFNSLTKDSFKGSSSTGYQSIESQNSWYFSDNSPVLMNSSNISFLINFSLPISDQLTQANSLSSSLGSSGRVNTAVGIYITPPFFNFLKNSSNFGDSKTPCFLRISNFFNSSNLSSMPCFITLFQLTFGNSFFTLGNSFGADIVNVAIFIPPNNSVSINKSVQIYKSFGLNKTVSESFQNVQFQKPRGGRGIGLILSKEPNANFKEIGTKFYSVFKRKGVQKKKLAREGEKWGEKFGKEFGEKFGKEFGENQKKILILISKDKFITIPKIAEKLNLTTRAIEKNIVKLKQKGLLKRIGGRKEGYWEIVGK